MDPERKPTYEELVIENRQLREVNTQLKLRVVELEQEVIDLKSEIVDLNAQVARLTKVLLGKKPEKSKEKDADNTAEEQTSSNVVAIPIVDATSSRPRKVNPNG